MNGVVLLNKPAGVSSAKYVYRLRPILGVRRIGHAGALDPFAEGMLLACVGKGTKLVEALMNLPKRYESTLQLGVTSASHDPEQPIEPTANVQPPTIERVEQALQQFVGPIEQVPPAFSAVKIEGRPAYKRARRNEQVDLRPRTVRIYSLKLINYDWPDLKIDIVCGRGTYIRALARDLGEALGCGAICATLKRLAIGPFGLDQAIRLEDVSPQDVIDNLLTIEQGRALVADYEPPQMLSARNSQ